MQEPVGNTRERIKQAALDLFVQQSYEKTSLRQIAERLGLTTAGLYYHYKTKVDIVRSIVSDFLAEIDEIVQWGEGQPRMPDTRAAVLDRYAEMVTHRYQAMQFFQQNPMIEPADVAERFRDRMRALHALLRSGDDPAEAHLRSLLAIVGLHLGISLQQAGSYPAGELERAAMRVSRRLVAANEAGTPADEAGTPANEAGTPADEAGTPADEAGSSGR
jgi:AcrR family transcriptional regulator